jgi:hypothetical protein
MADLQPQLDLIRWVKREEGFLHPGVEVASDPGNRGFYVRVGAGHTIRPNTRIASCPISTTVSVLNAMNIAPFSSRGTNFPHAFINNQSFTVVQYFFLMEQYLLGQKSWWAPYISAIPTPDAIDSMLFVDGSDDMRWLAGTNLKSALAKQNEKWKVLYMTALAQLEGLRWPNTENYTWCVDSYLIEGQLMEVLQAPVPVGSHDVRLPRLYLSGVVRHPSSRPSTTGRPQSPTSSGTVEAILGWLPSSMPVTGYPELQAGYSSRVAAPVQLRRAPGTGAVRGWRRDMQQLWPKR